MPTHGLTYKQRAFVNAYLGEARGNATKAAQIAGYKSPMQEGYRQLRKAEISAEISARLDELAMPTEEMLGILASQARGSLESFLRVVEEPPAPKGPTEDGDDEEQAPTPKRRIVLDLTAAANAWQLHLVKKCISECKPDGSERWSIELHDPQKAIAILAKMRGKIIDQHMHSGTTRTVTAKYHSDEELDKMTAEELSLAYEEAIQAT